jgi:hypothetical protein
MNEKIFSYDRVNFHKTFAPQDSYIAKILELAEQKYTGSKEKISELTGIPTGKTSGKVVPHIIYAYYMGLISYRLNKGIYSLELTELGDIVYKNDRYLFEDITKLICHFNICDEKEGAYIWSFVYRQLPLMFDEDISEEALKRKYKDFFQIDVDIRPLKKSYTDDGLWSALNILDFSNGLRINSSYYNDMMLYIYSYTLFSSWDKYFPSQQEITIDQIITSLNWSKRFGFDEDETIYALDQMEEENMVKVNKQLLPFTIIRTAETSQLLPHLYDLLN